MVKETGSCDDQGTAGIVYHASAWPRLRLHTAMHCTNVSFITVGRDNGNDWAEMTFHFSLSEPFHRAVHYSELANVLHRVGVVGIFCSLTLLWLPNFLVLLFPTSSIYLQRFQAPPTY